MKKYFITGLLVWAPLAITIWVIISILSTLDNVFGAVVQALVAFLPQAFQASLMQLRNVPGAGIFFILLIIIGTGAFAANIFGQWALRQWDRFLTRIPIVKPIYSSLKQVLDTVFATNGNAFHKALLIQYPRQGIWTIAFLTGSPSKNIAEHLNNNHVSVYLPTTPNPTSGFFLIIPKSDVIELDIKVDVALKYIVSMGVVSPENT